jgi:hypothetical protein
MFERNLAAKTEALNQRTVARNVNVGQVPEETATLTNEKQESASRVVVVLVLFEVLGEVFDALGQKCNLNLRGSSVTGVSCVFIDDRLFDICFESHGRSPFVLLVARCLTPDA